MIRVLSFGAGVQSTALLLMSCKKLLPTLDYCIFADVGNEPKKVYDHLEWCKKEAAKYSIPVITVKWTEKGLKDDVLDNIGRKDGGRVVSLPYFSAKTKGNVDGIVMRQCTGDYKIKPIIKFLREEVLGLKPRQRAPKKPVIEQWLGISFDESPRAKPSLEKWKTHVFPFLDWGIDAPMSKTWRRYQIINWLKENYPQIEVPRSACIICPFHSNEEWRRVKENPKEWEEACKFDEAIRQDKRVRKSKLDNFLYLHRSGKPLREADIRSDEQKGQGSLWDNECEGMCGL
tara:strand:+ start:1173 stop:2036 length:864 start_codon:yes stop_codon:yes gene_type:complete